MKEIEKRLPSLKVPVRVVYGERDRILPDVARTMSRVARDLPQTVVTAIPECGHFLQEERPDEVPLSPPEVPKGHTPKLLAPSRLRPRLLLGQVPIKTFKSN